MALVHAILSALIERACSGYDLAKQFDGSVGFFWQATHQQIYRELSTLEEKELISAKIISQEGRPDKKLYHVTEQGRKFLADWIAKPSSMNSVKDELLVKLFAGHLVEKEIIIAELERHRNQHLERLSAYKQIEQKYFADPQSLDIDEKFRYLTLRNGIRYEQEWLAWCDEAIAFLS
jgi:DNA-binding PadR family transcriptional regulator